MKGDYDNDKRFFYLFSGMKRDYDDDDDNGFRGQKRRRDNSDRMELRVLLQSKVILIVACKFRASMVIL